jgi:hypothetical protein
MPASELADAIRRETVAAMKARDKERLGVLRMLQAAIKQEEVDGRRELDDEDVAAVLRSYQKKVKDALAGARDSGREDLAAQAERELAVVASFLPPELSDEELAAVVDEAVAETGAASLKDMGRVMKVAMAKTGGRAEGARVSAAVKARLAG